MIHESFASTHFLAEGISSSGRKIACLQCRRSHVRCDGSRPCERCIVRRTVSECLNPPKESNNTEEGNPAILISVPWCRWKLSDQKILQLDNWNESFEKLVFNGGAKKTSKFEEVFTEPFQKVKINSKCSGETFTSSFNTRNGQIKRVLCSLWHFPERDNWIDIKIQPLEEVVLGTPEPGRSHLPTLLLPHSSFSQLTQEKVWIDENKFGSLAKINEKRDRKSKKQKKQKKQKKNQSQLPSPEPSNEEKEPSKEEQENSPTQSQSLAFQIYSNSSNLLSEEPSYDELSDNNNQPSYFSSSPIYNFKIPPIPIPLHAHNVSKEESCSKKRSREEFEINEIRYFLDPPFLNNDNDNNNSNNNYNNNNNNKFSIQSILN